MKKIEVGMLVEIVGCKHAENRWMIGGVGKVIKIVRSNFNTPAAVVDGFINPKHSGFGFCNIRPIEDDNASWDNEVWEKIGWNPSRVETCKS